MEAWSTLAFSTGYLEGKSLGRLNIKVKLFRFCIYFFQVLPVMNKMASLLTSSFLKMLVTVLFINYIFILSEMLMHKYADQDSPRNVHCLHEHCCSGSAVLGIEGGGLAAQPR